MALTAAIVEEIEDELRENIKEMKKDGLSDAEIIDILPSLELGRLVEEVEPGHVGLLVLSDVFDGFVVIVVVLVKVLFVLLALRKVLRQIVVRRKGSCTELRKRVSEPLLTYLANLLYEFLF